ncbi:MAG: hypothetical protein RIB47_15200 [Cyclobacteriaceae bacterium]
MKIAKLFTLICILISCEKKEDFALRNSVDIDIVRIDTLTVHKSTSGTIKTYLIGDDNLEYNIDFSRLEKSTYNLNSEAKTFFFADSVSIMLNNNKITIYKFKSNSEVNDGETAHFFTKKHGLLMLENTTWGNSTILKLWSYPILKQLVLFRNEIEDIHRKKNELFNEIDSVIDKELKQYER